MALPELTDSSMRIFTSHLQNISVEYERLYAENLELKQMLANPVKKTRTLAPRTVNRQCEEVPPLKTKKTNLESESNGGKIIEQPVIAAALSCQAIESESSNLNQCSKSLEPESESESHCFPKRIKQSGQRGVNRRTRATAFLQPKKMRFEMEERNHPIQKRLSLISKVSALSVDLESHLSPIGKSRRASIGLAGIKETLEEHLSGGPKYDVKEFYHTTGLAQLIARHAAFEHLSTFFVILNAIWMGVDTDWNTSDLILQAQTMFVVANHLFTIYFVAELIVRFAAFQRKCFCFCDAWFVFDMILVIVMITENWVMSLAFILMEARSGTVQNLLGNIAVLRTVRILRLVRLGRMLRLLKSFPQMLIMAKAIATAARSVCFTLILLLFVLYIFGITFSQILQGSNSGSVYFSAVLHSMNTLFLKGALLDNMSDLVNCLMDDNQYAMIALFYCVVVLANITLMNMLTGVLVSVISAVAEAEHEAILLDNVKDILMQVLISSDKNDDTLVNKTEFFSMFHSKMVVSALSEVGIDVFSLPKMAEILYDELESDGKQGLTFEELMEFLLKMRRQNVTTVKDLVDLKKWIQTHYDPKVHEFLTDVDEALRYFVEHSGSLAEACATKSNPRSEANLRIRHLDVGCTSSAKAHTIGMASPLQARVHHCPSFNPDDFSLR